jgi:phosphatidylglycerophosphate synthase
MMPFPSQRAALTLRSTLACALAGCAIGEAVVAWILGDRLGFGAWFAAKAAIVFGTGVFMVPAAAGRGHPFTRFGPANVLTTIRLAGVALIAACIGEGKPSGVALGIAGASMLLAVLDGVDGWLARRSGLASAFGARFDMEVDALLVMILSLLIWQYGKAPWWIVLAGLLRYAFVVSGWIWPRMGAPLPPSRRRRLVCVIQIVGLSVVMLPAIVQPASTWLAALLLLVLSGSFFVDTLLLWRQHD